MVKVAALRKTSPLKEFDDYSFEELYDMFQDMNKVLGLTDQDEKGNDIDVIVPGDIPVEELKEKIAEAIGYIRPAEDIFEESTQEIINAYKRVKIREKKEAGEEVEKDDIPEEDRIDDIVDKVKNAETLKALRDIAKSYRVFNEISLAANRYKMKEDMRDDMLRALIPVEVPAPQLEETITPEPVEKVDVKQEPAPKKSKKEVKEKPAPAPSPEPEPEKEVKKPAKDSILPKKIVTTKKPAPKKEKEKPAAREKYTRTRAVAETILENMKANPDDIIQLADDLFVRKGGKANIRHSRVQYNIIKQVLEIFNIL